jgi:hypothetical protein
MNPHLNMICGFGVPVNLNISVVPMRWSPLVIIVAFPFQDKRFRCKIFIDGLQPNLGWWYLACNECNCKAFEEGAPYRCSSYKCGSKGASPR